MKRDEMLKQTVKQLIDVHNEKAAQLARGKNATPVNQIKTWSKKKAELVDVILKIDELIEPAEVNVDELLDTKKPAEKSDKPKPKKRANGIDWSGTCTRIDDCDYKPLKENSKLYDVFTFCDGERTLDEIVKKYTGTDERSLKKQIRAIVRRGYRLEITNGKIALIEREQ